MSRFYHKIIRPQSSGRLRPLFRFYWNSNERMCNERINQMWDKIINCQKVKIIIKNLLKSVIRQCVQSITTPVINLRCVEISIYRVHIKTGNQKINLFLKKTMKNTAYNWKNHRSPRKIRNSNFYFAYNWTFCCFCFFFTLFIFKV